VEWIDTVPIAGQNLRDNGKDPLIGTVSFSLPLWWQKYSAGVREAQARRRAAVHERAHRELELATTLQMAVYTFRDAERKMDLYSAGLIPKAREALAANVTAYESGKASFLDLLDAQRVLLEFHLSHERALANRVQRLAEIEMIVGAPFPREEGSVVVDDGEEGAP
jgi:outer membrane protein TolC